MKDNSNSENFPKENVNLGNNPQPNLMKNNFRRKPLNSLILSFLMPGLGHLYNGQLFKAICFYIVVILLIFIFGITRIITTPSGFISFFVIYFSFLIYVVFDAIKTSKRQKEYVLKWYNRWYYYLLLYVLFALFNNFILSILNVSTWTISTTSNSPTLVVGDIILSDKNIGSKKPLNHGDMIVFKYPDGDTTTLEFQSSRSYYAMCREMGKDFVNKNFTVVSRPVDKREDYIQRCVGLPGDTLEIIDQQIIINGKVADNLQNREFNYIVQTDGNPINDRVLNDLEIVDGLAIAQGKYLFALTQDKAAKFKNIAIIKEVEKIVKLRNKYEHYIFPFSPHYQWNEDNFGPLYIPKAGASIKLDTVNIVLYDRIIHAYEGNDLKIEGDKIFINGKETDTYTFKMDYYWLMGDNRHNSADSRFWGFVPHDHVVGKAVFVWLSLDKDKSFPANIRWNKMFRVIK